jgi:hypothetical protein
MKNAYLNPYSPRAGKFLPRNRADWSRARLSAKFAPEFLVKRVDDSNQARGGGKRLLFSWKEEKYTLCPV